MFILLLSMISIKIDYFRIFTFFFHFVAVMYLFVCLNKLITAVIAVTNNIPKLIFLIVRP